MRRAIESYLIFLKEDLKIADACKGIKDGLLESIIDTTYFSEELAAYFTRTNPSTPFKINSTDPTQVAVLKKIINALEHAEKSFAAIENIDISRDRYTAMIVKDIVMGSYTTIHELYAALQLINHTNSDVQEIIGPHLQKLLPQLALASKALGEFTPEHPEEATGAALAGVVRMLPTKQYTETEGLEKFSSFIFELPHYFEELQKLTATGASGIATKSITSAEEYQAAMIKKANQIQRSFEKLTSRLEIIEPHSAQRDLHAEALKSHFKALKSGEGDLSSFPTIAKESLFYIKESVVIGLNYPALLRHYASIVKQLSTHSVELLSTGAPLTKQAYLDAAAKLEDIKHNQLPQLISELEMVEESLGLKAGLLTDPMLEQMNQYYKQLAQQVDSIAYYAGIIDSVSVACDSKAVKVVRFLMGNTKKLDVGEPLSPRPNLQVMMDDEFIAKRRVRQEIRFHEAHLASEDSSALTAARTFFDKIASYNTIHKALSKWSLANISQSEKDALITEYKQFQPHFAALYPDVDKLIVDALTKPTASTLVERLYSSEYQQLWGSDHFAKVLSCQESVLSNIQQGLAQSAFRARLIEKTMHHAEETTYVKHNKKTSLKTIVRPFERFAYVFEEDKPATYYHIKVITASAQISALKRAQDGVAEFFRYLLEKYPHQNPSFDSLSETDKEVLRKAYKKFQPHLLALGHDDINERLVASLNTSRPAPLSLKLTDLVSLKSGIEEFLTHTIQSLEDDKLTYQDQEHEARNVALSASTLVAQGKEFEKRTLFGQMSELKLSESIDTFFNTTFQTYLRDNLSETVWRELSSDGERIDVDKLPFLEFHKDSSEVVLYKQLINAFHHMKRGFAELESLHDYGDPSYLYHRSRFVMTTFNALIMNINFSKYYIDEASKNPGLRAMLQEGLDLLKPLEGMPLIGEYLNSAEQQTPPVQNIISVWKKQLRVVEAGLSRAPRPKTEQQLIIEQLVKIQQGVDKLSDSMSTKDAIKSQIDQLAKHINHLSFSPGTAPNILNHLMSLVRLLPSLT